VDDPVACFQELYAHFAQPSAWRCEPGTASVLAGLAARGCTLGLASNFDARLNGVARGLPELAAVMHVVISSLIGWRKPAPEFFAILCRTVGVPAEQILFVGDDVVNDYQGAQAAGMLVLLLDPHGKADVPDGVRIRSLGEILDR
jgi:putative hydrolase of the HAD superfamily